MAEAGRRLDEYGPNAIAQAKTYGFVGVLLRELKEPMILLLVIIAAIYSILGDPRDSIVIVAIVFIVVFIETYNVNRARKSMQALRNLTLPHSMVYRDGILVKENTDNLVPGDIAVITSGERIPADGRLVESYSLKVDESSLTGESFSVIKDAETTPVSKDLAELSNMVFSGTLVVQGTGRLLITSTGKETEIGKISELVGKAEEAQTPLGKTMVSLTKILASLAVLFSILIPLVGYLQGKTLDEMLLTSLSMAFATVPEELPVLISITLAIGAYALSRHNAVVKDLKAAETLGSVTVIATDKTGTITENRMSVGHLYSNGDLRIADSGDNIELMEQAVLATGTLMLEVREPTSFKDPMEVATFEYSHRIGIDINSLRNNYTALEEFSFDNRIKLSSFLYRKDRQELALYVSGAPEVVIARSTFFTHSDGEIYPMDKDRFSEIQKTVDEISSLGERTIAIASRSVEEFTEDRNKLEQGLTFIGLISFIDPPRKEVPDAIRECQEAGIRVVMLTGDHPKTAKSIADQVGINRNGRVLTGKEISAMDDEELSKLLTDTSIFARITSEDKYRIVDLLKKSGETVAVTGDGVNDSPALQNAEIGIAMGIRGTEVAREASDMILLDDNFATIVKAVHEGRQILYTLRKSVKYEISVKIALIMVLFVPLILIIPFPFSPIQIIVMELMMDVAALGGFLYEREEAGLMKQPPKKNGNRFFDRSVTSTIVLSAITISLAVTGVYLYILYSSGFVLRAQTAAFSVWMLSQIFLAHNLRTERVPVFVKGILSNRVIVIWAVVIALALVVITVIPDLQVLLHTVYLTYFDWVLILLASLASTFWLEGLKTFWYLRSKRSTRSSK